MIFTLSFDETKIADVQRMFGDVKKGLPERIVIRATNRVLSGVRTDTSFEVREVVKIKKPDLDPKLTVYKAGTNFSGKVKIDGVILPLLGFEVKQDNIGVTAKVYKSGGTSAWPSAFIATMKSGHKGVFLRKRKWHATGVRQLINKNKIKPEYRLPIKQIFGPRLSTIVLNPTTWAKIGEKINGRLDVALDAEINYEMSKL